MPEVIAPPIKVFKDSAHTMGNCSDCLEEMDRSAFEITALLNAVLFYATQIRHYPDDTNGVVDYASGKIISLIEKANSKPYSEWRKEQPQIAKEVQESWKGGKNES